MWQLAKILNPSLGVIANVDVTYRVFCSTKGSKNDKRSDGAFSIFLKTSHKPYSAAIARGPFLKTNSPTSLQI